MVNESKGTVRTPVTQVALVAVKKQSRNEIGTVCDAGSQRHKVPKKMVRKMVNKTVLPGEKKIRLWKDTNNSDQIFINE